MNAPIDEMIAIAYTLALYTSFGAGVLNSTAANLDGIVEEDDWLYVKRIPAPRAVSSVIR